MMSRTNSTSAPRGDCLRPCRSWLTPTPCPAGALEASVLLATGSVRFVEDLGDHALGLLLVRARGEDQLGDEDLPGLRQHPQLAGAQALLTFADGQVPHHLGDLVDVTRAKLLDVVLEPASPVRGHLGLVLAQ